jgi:hypothetical protein
MFRLNTLKTVLTWPFKIQREHFLFGKEEDHINGTMTVDPHNKVLSDILDENGDAMMTTQPEAGPSEQLLQGMCSFSI